MCTHTHESHVRTNRTLARIARTHVYARTLPAADRLHGTARHGTARHCRYVVLLHLWVFYVLSHHQPAHGLNDRPCPPGGK